MSSSISRKFQSTSLYLLTKDPSEKLKVTNIFTKKRETGRGPIDKSHFSWLCLAFVENTNRLAVMIISEVSTL
jgi:hypothetical protein